MSTDYSAEFIRKIALETRTIAMVGASVNPARPSSGVMRFLQRKGFRVIPVNPVQTGREINGEAIYTDLASIPAELGDIQMLDLFRRSDDVVPIVDQAIQHLLPRGLRTIWMQLGVENQKAAELALYSGLQVVMNRCPTVEWSRLI